jgi:DNA segregation ATPase FtsK/SpoIIIE-like protein
MVDGNQKNGAQRQKSRVVPSIEVRSSRVSSAAGGVGSQRAQKTHVEQRSNIPSSRQGARNLASPKQTQRGKQDLEKKKGASPNRPSAISALPPPDPKDIHFLRWTYEQWNSLDHYQQQSIVSGLLLALSFLLFGALTIFNTVPILSAVEKFFLTFFGWSSYFLVLGLVAYSFAHLIEGVRRQEFIRWSVIFGLILIWLLVLTESRLIMGEMSVGVLAELLVLPLLGWSPAIGHLLLIGVLLITIILTFRIRFGHILMVVYMLQSMTSDEGKTHADEASSPYLEQLPSHIAGRAVASSETAASPRPSRQAGRRRIASDDEIEAIPAMPPIVSSWKLPATSLLNDPEEAKLHMFSDNVEVLARTIQETLRSFRVEAEVRPDDISIGPTIIRFGIRPTGKPEMMLDEKIGKMVPVRDASGAIVYAVRTRVSRIMALQNDLALVLEAKTIRMEAPVPGRPYVGVEIPNKNSRLVTLREILESKEYQSASTKSKLAVVLGRDVAGLVRVADLAKMPHLLIAGATGSGKSVMVNAIIASILTQATPDDVRMLMVDPKMVELTIYNGIPHLLSPVVTEVEKVVPLLKNTLNEMEQRYRLFSQIGVRNLDGYRKLRLERLGKGDTTLNNLPSIIIIIDELADLMMAAPEEVEGMICRLAQLARATGIHLVIATQRPSVDVITGLIKANIPTRISFMVSSAVDSRTIIDMGGAERLLGRGDMLYLPADAGRPERVQGAFLSDEEAAQLADYWQQQAEEHAREHLAPLQSDWEIKERHFDEFLRKQAAAQQESSGQWYS